MIRIIARDTDIGAALHIGGPVNVTHKTFDVSLPSLEAWLSDKHDHRTREVVGVEFIQEPIEIKKEGAK